MKDVQHIVMAFDKASMKQICDEFKREPPSLTPLFIAKADALVKRIDQYSLYMNAIYLDDEVFNILEGKLIIVFEGFDDDPRELHEIKEVKLFIKKLNKIIPCLFYFLSTDTDCPSGANFIFHMLFKDVNYSPNRITEEMKRQQNNISKRLEALGRPVSEASAIIDRVLGVCYQ